MEHAAPAPGAGEAGFLSVGIVRRPHGVRGEVELALETDRPKSVFRPGRTLRIGTPDGRPRPETVVVERSRPFKDGLLLKLEGRDERDAVEALRGATLLIGVAEAAPAAADEVPYHRLVGSEVLVDGRSVGVVHEVLEAGGGEMLAVRRPRGGELLIPFVREMVRHVDAEGRRVEIAPPEGLLDL